MVFQNQNMVAILKEDDFLHKKKKNYSRKKKKIVSKPNFINFNL